jgi:heme A synthase
MRYTWRAMERSTTPTFRRLTVITATAVYLLMVIGGVVRITESGLGCPDWPLCHGKPLPPLELTAIIEYTHRSVALIGGLLILAVAIMAWRSYRSDRWVSVPALGVIALLAIQIPLGGLVVINELRPALVAIHLGTAMLILGSSLSASVAAQRPHPMPQIAVPLWYRTLLASTLFAVFVLLMTGALVVGTGSSYICRGWPLCGSATGDTGLALNGVNPAVAVSMYHRYVVMAVSVLVSATVIQTLRLRHLPIEMRRWAMVLGALFVAQIAIGAAQVLLGMPTLWRVLHLAAATGVWASLIVIGAQAVLLIYAAAPARARKPVTPSHSPAK